MTKIFNLTDPSNVALNYVDVNGGHLWEIPYVPWSGLLERLHIQRRSGTDAVVFRLCIVDPTDATKYLAALHRIGVDVTMAGVDTEELVAINEEYVLQDRSGVSPTKAWDYTAGGNPSDGDTFEIGGWIWTFRDTPRSSMDVEIATAPDDTYTNLVTAVNAAGMLTRLAINTTTDVVTATLYSMYDTVTSAWVADGLGQHHMDEWLGAFTVPTAMGAATDVAGRGTKLKLYVQFDDPSGVNEVRATLKLTPRGEY